MPTLACISLKERSLAPIPSQTVLCLGNFDGVHRAHRELLRSASEWQKKCFPNAKLAVFCFREYPSDVLGKGEIGHLCSPDERMDFFLECGVEYAILADFEELRQLSPEIYLGDVLKRDCHAVGVACGFNHRFGKGGAGTPTLLQANFTEDCVLCLHAILEGDEAVSSTRIRALIADGRVDRAAELLGRPYRLTAPVLHGKALGRSLGTPTVNQNFPRGMAIPAIGVYATTCEIDGKTYVGVSNVGRRPSVDDGEQINCETYLVDFSGNLYGRTLTILFHSFIRPEKKFEDLSELGATIKRDGEYAKALLGRN
jgi:riboflavin kinase/FMN adenylyltransferase